MPAAKVGENPGEQFDERVVDPPTGSATPPASWAAVQGVSRPDQAAVPHLGAVASTPREPPLSFSSSVSNGTRGF